MTRFSALSVVALITAACSGRLIAQASTETPSFCVQEFFMADAPAIS